MWMSLLSQAKIDKIALKTGFKTLDGSFNPDKSAEFNEAINQATAAKLLGKSKSDKKAAASRENGRKGGRPKVKMQLKDWQFDPESVKTEMVQFWSKSGCMMGVRPLGRAQDAVRTGTHFVMCDQAIGEFDDERMLKPVTR